MSARRRPSSGGGSPGAAPRHRIPGARFEVLAEEAHQPFEEGPDAFNARVDAF
jgi:pimeloyl-ACP methyl ester carboxylesterase